MPYAIFAIYGKQPGFTEGGISDGLRRLVRCTGYPFGDLIYVASCTQLHCRRAVELAKDATPEPLVDAVPGLLGRKRSPALGQAGDNDCQGNNLLIKRNLIHAEDASLRQEL